MKRRGFCWLLAASLLLGGCFHGKDGEDVSLAGTIIAASSSLADGDVNDPNAPYASNDDFSQAQLLANPVTLGGYVNQPGTGEDGPSKTPGDISDFYRVSLAAGQSIVLSIAEPTMDANFNILADLDLYLYPENTPDINNPLRWSEGSGYIESITVPDNGTYYIEVYAANRASNYVLSIGQAAASLAATDDFVPGEVIVRFRDEGLSAKGLGTLQARAQSLGLEGLAGGPGRAMLMRLGEGEQARGSALRALGVPETGKRSRRAPDAGEQRRRDTLRVVEALRARPDVLYAEPNYLRRALAVPSDTFYSRQWHYPLINLPQAWDLTTGVASVTVGVIDTGVLLGHDDLQGQLTGGYDFIRSTTYSLDGDGIDGNPDDPGDQSTGGSSFHGTHVAGTVAAASNNGLGVAGAAWGVKAMPLRVLGKGGVGSSYDILQAVKYAAGLANDAGPATARRADIINLSLGGGSFSQAEQDVYTQAVSAGVIVIAAAGNESTSAPSYPAAYQGVVSVSAVDINKGLAPYSNFGATIDVAAPGGDTSRDANGDGYPDGVLSTVGDDASGTVREVYKFFQGTSMAAPHMAGVVALMKSVYPGLTPAGLDAALAAGSLTQDIGTPGRDNQFGHGLIDAYKAVSWALAQSGGGGAPQPVLVVGPSSLNFGTSGTAALLSALNGGDGALAIASVSDDATWLAVAEQSVNGDKLGSYAVTVDRSGLADGIYTATITFISDQNTVTVPVILQKASMPVAANAGYLYILLVDPVSGDAVYQAEATAVNGRYGYRFADIARGDYQIFAGTDSNNDGYICDAGEACGAYATVELPDIVSVTGRHAGVDFGAGFDFFLSSDGYGVGTGDAGPGVRRIKVMKKVQP